MRKLAFVTLTDNLPSASEIVIYVKRNKSCWCFTVSSGYFSCNLQRNVRIGTFAKMFSNEPELVLEGVVDSRLKRFTLSPLDKSSPSERKTVNKLEIGEQRWQECWLMVVVSFARIESRLNKGLTGWHQMARGRVHQHAAFSERNTF